jgi:hypothetical protein
MKVKDLIEKLETFNPEALVVTRGLDEEGFADIQSVTEVHVQLRKSESARQTIGEYESSKGGDVAVLVDHI